MKSHESSSPEATPQPSLFGRTRNRLATCLVAGAAAMGCASGQQTPPELSSKQKYDLREDVLKELELRKMCEPFNIEVGRKKALHIGLSDHEHRMVELFPSHDALIQKLLLCYPNRMHDSDGALSLITKDIRVIRFVSEDLLSSPDFMLKAARIDKRVLDYGRPALFENPSFIKAIVQIDPKHIKYAFPYHLNHPGLFVKMMQTNPTIMDHLPKHVSANAEFMESVGYLDPRAYIFHDVDVYRRKKGEGDKLLSNGIWHDEDYARMVTKSEHIYNLKFFSSHVRANASLMLELMKTDPRAYHYRDHSIRGDESLMRAWLQTKHKINASGTNVVRLRPDEIDALMAELKALDIEFPDRFSLNELDTVIKHRKGFQKDLDEEKKKRKAKRFGIKPNKKESEAPEKPPITLHISAKADWNGAFLNSVTDDFIIKGEPILYFEVNTKYEAFKIMDDLILAKQPVNHLPISGHGSKNRIATGAPDPRLYKAKARNRKHYFDRSDWLQLRKRRKLLTPDARIIFDSCSVGEGGAGSWNISNTFADAFPQARIYSAKVPTSIERLIFGKDGAVSDVIFSSGLMSTYQRHPKEVNECLATKRAESTEQKPDYTLTQGDLRACRDKVFNPESQSKVVAKPQPPIPRAGSR